MRFLPPIPATPDVTFSLAEYEALLHADAETKLLKLRHTLSAKHLKARARVGHGPAAEEIVLIARKEEADLIAIATHGETGVERIVFGSVTEKVVRIAACPVLTIRPGASKVKRGWWLLSPTSEVD